MSSSDKESSDSSKDSSKDIESFREERKERKEKIKTIWEKIKYKIERIDWTKIVKIVSIVIGISLVLFLGIYMSGHYFLTNDLCDFWHDDTGQKPHCRIWSDNGLFGNVGSCLPFRHRNGTVDVVCSIGPEGLCDLNETLTQYCNQESFDILKIIGFSILAILGAFIFILICLGYLFLNFAPIYIILTESKIDKLYRPLLSIGWLVVDIINIIFALLFYKLFKGRSSNIDTKCLLFEECILGGSHCIDTNEYCTVDVLETMGLFLGSFLSSTLGMAAICGIIAGIVMCIKDD